MEDTELFAMEEDEQATLEKPAVEERPAGKRQFNDTLLTQLMCPAPVPLPRGCNVRRVYGVMSDTPLSRRTRLYQIPNNNNNNNNNN
jgi:hypothetical protein